MEAMVKDFMVMVRWSEIDVAKIVVRRALVMESEEDAFTQQQKLPQDLL
jgi:hypothetical protein